MKSKLQIVTTLTVLCAFLIVGCGKSDGDTQSKSYETTGDAASKVESTFASMKSSYVAEAQKLVTDWGTKVSGLEEKKSSLPAIAQKPLEDSFKALTDGKAGLDEKFNDLKGANEDTFDGKKEEFTQSVSKLSGIYDGLMSKF